MRVDVEKEERKGSGGEVKSKSGGGWRKNRWGGRGLKEVREHSVFWRGK